MDTKFIVLGLLTIALIALGIGGAVYTGVGPSPGGATGTPISDFPTATESDSTPMSGDRTGSTATPDPFSFTIEQIEECGRTCRDVTASVRNNQDQSATGVTVYTRVFAGEDTVDESNQVWEGAESIGAIGAHESHTSTTRVELSLQDGRKIEQQDGWITILTSIESDDQTVTFRNNEQVA